MDSKLSTPSGLISKLTDKNSSFDMKLFNKLVKILYVFHFILVKTNRVEESFCKTKTTLQFFAPTVFQHQLPTSSALGSSDECVSTPIQNMSKSPIMHPHHHRFFSPSTLLAGLCPPLIVALLKFTHKYDVEAALPKVDACF